MVRNIEVRVHDVAGRLVTTIDATCPGGCRQPQVEWSLDLSQLGAGHFYLVVTAKDIFLNESSRGLHGLKVP